MYEKKHKGISFTPQKRLEDTQQEYIDNVYRFRRAKAEQPSGYASTKREMLHLEAKLVTIRKHIYRGTACKLFKIKQTVTKFNRFPESAWVVQ